MIGRGTHLTTNLYVKTRDSKKDFPLLLEFIVFGRVGGVGSLASLSKGIFIPRGDDRLLGCVDLHLVPYGEVPIHTSFPQASHSLYRVDAGFSGGVGRRCSCH